MFIRITGLIGTYTDPRILIAYSDGQVARSLHWSTPPKSKACELAIDDEYRTNVFWSTYNCLLKPYVQSLRYGLDKAAVFKGCG
jgi:hypothetical protein